MTRGSRSRKETTIENDTTEMIPFDDNPWKEKPTNTPCIGYLAILNTNRRKQ